MAQATFLLGKPVMVDHTPGGAVAAGDVVIVGRVPMIAHSPIASGALGALAARGGVYTVNGDAAIDAGRRVYWNNTNDEVTETASGNLLIGFTISACAGDGLPCNIAHEPNGAAAA